MLSELLPSSKLSYGFSPMVPTLVMWSGHQLFPKLPSFHGTVRGSECSLILHCMMYMISVRDSDLATRNALFTK